MSRVKGFLDAIQQREREHQLKKKEKRKEHKCHNCLWSSWLDDEKVVCTFSRCVKEEKRL